MAKFRINASCSIWCPNFELMQVAPSGDQILNLCKWRHLNLPDISQVIEACNAWVRCASGNVFCTISMRKEFTCVEELHEESLQARCPYQGFSPDLSFLKMSQNDDKKSFTVSCVFSDLYLKRSRICTDCMFYKVHWNGDLF